MILTKLQGDVVVDVFAAFGREAHSFGDEFVPLLFCQSLLQHVAGDAGLNQSEDESSIEVVASPDGADNSCAAVDGVSFCKCSMAHFNGQSPLGVDKVFAIEGNLRAIDSISIFLFEEHIEVFVATSDYVSHSEVLQEIGGELHHLVLMGRSEVDIIVDDRPTTTGIVEKTLHLWTDDGVQGIVGAEEYDVVGIDLRINEVQLVTGMVFIEDVFSIVAVVEESQRQRRLRVGKHVDVFCVDSVLLQEVDDALPYSVVTRFADEVGRHAAASQRNHGVKRRPTWYSSRRLVVSEDDIEDGLPDSYYLSHSCSKLSTNDTLPQP